MLHENSPCYADHSTKLRWIQKQPMSYRLAFHIVPHPTTAHVIPTEERGRVSMDCVVRALMEGNIKK